jgi:hypothetical protein
MSDTPIVEGDIGEHVDTAIERALREAVRLGCLVYLKFNGTLLPVSPTDTQKKVRDEWDVLMAKRQKEWEESPAGKQYAAEMEASRAKQEAREAAGEVHDEAVMRKSRPPTIKTPDQLTAYIESLVNGKHDYGTCAYAMSLAATAAFNYVAGQLGATGFQASCADLDFIRRTRGIEGPFMLIKAQDMLYPQYDVRNQLEEAMDKWKPWLKEAAAKCLAEHGGAHPRVLAHWEALTNG